MERFEDKDRTLKHLELKVGIMVSIAAVGIILFLVVLGLDKEVFTRKIRVNFIAPTATGFIEGMPVNLSGFKIGWIDDLDLNENGTVRVRAVINAKYRQWLRIGMKARLVKEGFIGDSVVELTPGIEGGVMLDDGDMIIYEKATGIDVLFKEATPVLLEIKQLMARANAPDSDFRSALAGIRSFMEYANDPEGGVKKTIANISEFVEYANGLEGDLRKTLSNLREFTEYANDPDGEIKAAAANIRDVTEGLTVVVDEAEVTIRELRAVYGSGGLLAEKGLVAIESVVSALDTIEKVAGDMRPVIEKLDMVARDGGAFAEELPELGTKLNDVMDDIKGEMPRIKAILADLEDTVREGKAVVEGVSRAWPVKGMIEEPAPPGLVPLDSYVGEER